MNPLKVHICSPFMCCSVFDRRLKVSHGYVFPQRRSRLARCMVWGLMFLWKFLESVRKVAPSAKRPWAQGLHCHIPRPTPPPHLLGLGAQCLWVHRTHFGYTFGTLSGWFYVIFPHAICNMQIKAIERPGIKEADAKPAAARLAFHVFPGS